MKRLVNKARPRNKTELIRALNDAWAEATSAKNVEALYNSMDDRMHAIISAKGGNTKY